MVTRCLLYSFLSLFSFMVATAQQELPLYGTGPIPNSKAAADEEKDEPSGNPVRHSLSKVSRPTIAVYLPAAGTGNGTAVIICPGGGYDHLAITHEGTDVAQALSGMGIAAFVLKYRLPSDETMVDKTIGPLQDAQRAIQLVRQRAADWGVNPDRVGIMGFSAGGHLASTAGTHFNKAYFDNKDNISLRPDFMVLLYPVISFNYGYAHHGSRNNLIGPHPDTGIFQRTSGYGGYPADFHRALRGRQGCTCGEYAVFLRGFATQRGAGGDAYLSEGGPWFRDAQYDHER
jgi:acetyl esterase/lipase